MIYFSLLSLRITNRGGISILKTCAVDVNFKRQTGIKLRRWGYKSDTVIRVNFVNPTINKYFNTTLYMNTTLLTDIPGMLISNG